MQYKHDWFVETMPEVIELVAQGEARGKIEGEARGKIEGKIEGKVEGLRHSVVLVVQSRFPRLEKQARRHVARISSTEDLEMLMRQCLTVPTQEDMRGLLRARRPRT